MMTLINRLTMIQMFLQLPTLTPLRRNKQYGRGGRQE